MRLWTQGFFSANSSGMGAAAATFVIVRADGFRVEDVTFRSDLPEGSRTNIPIDLGEADDEVFVSFFRDGLSLPVVRVGSHPAGPMCRPLRLWPRDSSPASINWMSAPCRAVS